MNDLISRQAAIEIVERYDKSHMALKQRPMLGAAPIVMELEELPSAQPEQRYTEEELMVFRHGISLSLLSKRSAQHWQYDEDTATEIKFLERLYEKVGADMKGGQE